MASRTRAANGERGELSSFMGGRERIIAAAIIRGTIGLGVKRRSTSPDGQISAFAAGLYR